MFEAIAAPVLIEGPCNPTDPPNPTVNGAVIRDAYILYLSISPFLLDNEKSVDGIACPIFFGMRYF